MNADRLNLIDQWIYSYLSDHVDVMPRRLCKIIAYYYTDARVRKLYWRRLGVEMGEDTYANIGMMIVPNDNTPCVLIGAHVSIAPNVTFICSSSPNNGCEIRTIPYVKEKLTTNDSIVVNDDVWIGANVTILLGITIGKCSVIGAGSVVTKDVEPYSIYAGVPARRMRDI